MAQFTLNWDNTNVLANVNAIGQRASYRSRLAGGAYITVGFSPTNDLPTSAETTDSPVITDNLVYQFKIETLCTASGPTINDNGIQEAINFACITPTLTKTDVQIIAVLTVTGTDITKARFTLRKASDNSLIDSVIVSRVSNSITYIKAGLTGSTNYYVQVELYAIVNNIEVKSSDSGYLNTVCSPYAFTTDASATCAPITAMTVTSIEL